VPHGRRPDRPAGNGGANVAAAPVSVRSTTAIPPRVAFFWCRGLDRQPHPGEFEDVSLAVSPPLAGTHTICAVAADNGSGVGSFNECNETTTALLRARAS